MRQLDYQAALETALVEAELRAEKPANQRELNQALVTIDALFTLKENIGAGAAPWRNHAARSA